MAQNLDPASVAASKDMSNGPSPEMIAALNAGGNPGLSDWLTGAWNTYSGKTAFSTPENVYNPMANYNRDPSQQARGQQMLAQQYYANALNGRNPSLANEQMKQGIAQAQHQQMAAASGSRGIDRAAAFRQAQNNAAQMGAQGAIAGGQQRLQEQQQAAQGMQQGAGQMRQQDVGEQLGLGQLQNQAQSNLNKQYEIDANVQSGNAARQQSASGNLVAAAGAALGGLFSDIRSKENISPLGDFYSSVGMPSQAPAAEPDNYDTKQSAEAPKSGGGMDSMMGGMALGSMLSDRDSKENLSSVHGYEFDYKDPDAQTMAMQAAHDAFVQTFMDAKKPREGVMAQDLQKNPETAPIVQQSNERNRLMLDGKRALGFILANMGDLNERLSRVEGGGR